MPSKKDKFSDCYKLDHGGIIYPYIAKADWNQVFRLEAELDEDIDVQSVLKALQNLRERFPSFFVIMEKRKILYLLKKTDEMPEIVPEGKLCRQFNLLETEHPLFRITYKGPRLGIELFHSVADGNGAIIFFINLIAEYYAVKGFDIPKTDKVFDHGFNFEERDTENSFLKVFEQGGKTSSRSEKPAYQYNGGKADCKMRLSTFCISIESLKERAKKCGATITEFLAAIYTKALCLSAAEDGAKTNVKIEIPLDLRRRFDSATLRNFSLYFITSISADRAYNSIDSIAGELKPQFAAGADNKKLRNDVYTNVSQSEMLIFKGLPRFMKKGVLKLGNSIYGERLFTSPFSNIGIVTMPDKLKKHVKSLGFIIGKTLKNTVYSGIISFDETLYWSVSCVAEKKDLENNIASILKDEGISFNMTER